MSSLNETPSAERTHIAFFGCRNAGKSSLVNAVTGQELSIVSNIKGTTTDPVRKSMELLHLGAVVIIDTPGIDDEGALGEKRVEKTRKILDQADIAVLVVDGLRGLTPADEELLSLIKDKQLPYLVALNKADAVAERKPVAEDAVWVSALTGLNVKELKKRIAALAKPMVKRTLLAHLIKPQDLVVLVCPIDEAAPKGRLILPQQQAIRDIIDTGAIALVTQVPQLQATLDSIGGKAAMVVTDSQAFKPVSQIVPESIPLTSFSILMAEYKGFLKTAAEGAAALKDLKTGDKILVAEGCTHHRQCNDIGTVKLPRMLSNYTGKDLQFVPCSGRDFPEDLTGFAAVIHCGGCMLTERTVQNRMARAVAQGVPFTNYGIAIAQVTGILQRSLSVFGREPKHK